MSSFFFFFFFKKKLSHSGLENQKNKKRIGKKKGNVIAQKN